LTDADYVVKFGKEPFEKQKFCIEDLRVQSTAARCAVKFNKSARKKKISNLVCREVKYHQLFMLTLKKKVSGWPENALPHPNHWVPEGLGALDSEAVKLLSSVGSGKCQQIEWFPNGLPCVRYSSTEFPDTLQIDGLAMEALLFAKLGQAPSKLVCCFGNLLIENYTLPEYDDMLAVFGKPPEQAADLMTGIPITKFEIEHSHAGVLTADGNLEMFGRLEGADGRAPRGPPAEESSQMKIDAADESNMQKNRDEGASRSPSFVPAHDTNRVEAVMCDSIPESSTNRLTPIQPIPQADRDEPAHPNAIPGGREPDKGTAQEGVVQDEVIAMPPPHLASGQWFVTHGLPA